MAEPKFSLWLGDDWPGPYLVTHFTRDEKRQKNVVVNGVTNMVDAAYVAAAEFPNDENEYPIMVIKPVKVAEASHHMGALAKSREASEKLRVEVEEGRRAKDQEVPDAEE